MWYAYAILCEDGSIYKGHTNDIKRRYEQHLNGLGAVHTQKHKPQQLIYTEEFDTKSEAIAHEKYLKSGSGREMLATIKDLPAGRQGVL